MQFAKVAGATVIATTSSQEKADVLKKIGADHIINYKEDENWGETAKGLTPGKEGVDHIIEVGGPNTLKQVSLSRGNGLDYMGKVTNPSGNSL